MSHEEPKETTRAIFVEVSKARPLAEITTPRKDIEKGASFFDVSVSPVREKITWKRLEAGSQTTAETTTSPESSAPKTPHP